MYAAMQRMEAAQLREVNTAAVPATISTSAAPALAAIGWPGATASQLDAYTEYMHD